ncbi:MAG: acyl carrier protein [Gammaproteobacteria bacterium]|nr:acyl carrier protein [Gammaproteobacteria bacterium]
MSNEQQIKERMSEILNQPRDALDNEAELTSLVTSSFVLVEMIIELQEELGVRFGQADMEEVSTVGQLVDLFVSRR